MTAQRYTAVAILLHWAIALSLVGMIALGWWMGEALEASDTQAQAIAAFQLHKSIGLTILALSFVRLAWRFMNPPPSLPEGMKAWERAAAVAAHWGFYFLIIAMPLTGWLYVSTAWSVHDERALNVPTLYFGLFQVPHLFGLEHLAEQSRAALAEAFEFSHSKMAWGVIGLTALHVGAALKHHFVDKDDVLARMVPGLAPAGDSAPARGFALLGGFAAILLASALAVWAFYHPPTGRGAAPVEVAHSHDGDTREAEADRSEDEAHADDGHSHGPAAVAPTGPGAPPVWNVVQAESSISFSGVHAGVPFEGRFNQWGADIRFDAGDLSRSTAVVTIQTGSASDGVPLHDQSLPGAEWFDSARHPTATYRTSSIRARGDGAYEARGALTIKGRAIETRLPFTLNIDGDRAVMDGIATVRRDEADLGMASDPEAEYVSREITVRVHVEATRAR